MKDLSSTSRTIIALASLALIGTLFLPIWNIDLWAPQYPEGLAMQIWLSKLTGDVEIINGLNHYIGMAHIKEEMFPEFSYLPYVVIGFALLGLLAALLKSFRLLLGLVALLAIGGALGLYDFWRWAYEYGHNLDPTAPIQVPGMTYQPPMFGYKALLNFGAYSMPDVGGWLFFAAGLAIAGTAGYEWFYRQRKSVSSGVVSPVIKNVAFIMLASTLAMSCTTEANPIQYGKDDCQHCKMTIVDQKFAAVYVTPKGKTYKFDDVACLTRYQHDNAVPDADMSQILVADYANPGVLIEAKTATFRQGDDIHSPMGGNTAAFVSTETAGKATGIAADDETITWKNLNLSHAHH